MMQDISNNARAMMKLTNGADHAKHSLSSLTFDSCPSKPQKGHQI
jgi:hypothetical protein